MTEPLVAEGDRAFVYRASSLLFLFTGIFGGAVLYGGRQYLHPEPTALVAAGWALLTEVSLFAALGLVSLFDRFSDRHLPSGRSRSVATFGALLVAGLAAGLTRSLLAPFVTGHPLEPARWVMAAVNLLLTFVPALLFFRRGAALRGRQAVLDHALAGLGRNLDRARSDLVDRDENQRRQAAEILHGEVQMRLFLAWDCLCQAQSQGAATPSAARSLVEKALSHVDHAIGEDLERVRGTFSGDTASAGLAADLERLGSWFGPVLPLELDLQRHPDIVDLPDDLVAAAVRLVQEALLNALKHSRARSVRLVLRVLDRQVLVAVEDDGIGFDPATSRYGLGLSEVGKTLEAHGGSYGLRTAPGRGTGVEARLPLSSASSQAVRR